jgi:hypothetical protein
VLVSNTTYKGKLILTIPAGVTLPTASTCTLISPVGLTGTAACTTPNNGGDKVIHISDGFTGTFAAATTISFSIGSFTNSMVKGSAGTLKISTALTEIATLNDYTVDEYSSTTDITMTAGTIGTITVSSTSAEAYKADVNYTINFQPQHAIK